MMEYLLKIFERIIVVCVKEKVTINNMQFGFMGGKGTQMPFS